jgi:hypothetical protein
MPRIAGLGLALLAFAGALHAATPRKNVANIAQAVEDNYFDVARGRQIAADLRAEAASGKYDALKDDRDLATALTDRLKPFDQHFTVRWTPPEPAGTAREPAARAAPATDHGRRTNYGVRRVEVQPGNIGYIDLREFAHFQFGQPDQPARRAIDAALQLVAGTDALIIDLRNNGGGSPAMVGYLASAFTAKGADIYNTFRTREGDVSEAPAEWHAAPRLQTPLYVLTSARTGSAAEALAYTLKNAGRARVVGEPSAGAANPGGAVAAGNGFSVFVSTGSPVSPITRTNWEGSGVMPDVAVPAATAFETAKALALEAVLRGDLPDAEKVDTRWALEALRAEATPPKDVPLDDYAGSYGALAIARDGDHLVLRRGRRPALTLVALGQDAFTVAAESSSRVLFERGADGKVIALETKTSEGASGRHRREG